MVVGLLRSKNAKKFYDLGVVESFYELETKRTVIDPPQMPRVYRWREFCGTIRTFELHMRGRGRYAYETNRVCIKKKTSYVKLCDETKPHTCKSDDCPHRFKCLTSYVNIETSAYYHYQ